MIVDVASGLGFPRALLDPEAYASSKAAALALTGLALIGLAGPAREYHNRQGRSPHDD